MRLPKEVPPVPELVLRVGEERPRYYRTLKQGVSLN